MPYCFCQGSADEDVAKVLNRWVQILQKEFLSMKIWELGHMGLPERSLQTYCWASKQPELYPDDHIGILWVGHVRSCQ